jgi:hypothetical protein
MGYVTQSCEIAAHTYTLVTKPPPSPTLVTSPRLAVGEGTDAELIIKQLNISDLAKPFIQFEVRAVF